MSPEKVEVVRTWPVPKTVKEVRSFLGLANWFRRFIRRFAATAVPLYALTEKGRLFKWGEEEQAAFEQLRLALSSAPVVACPDPSRPYILYTDASALAGGAVLCQDFGEGPRAIAFESFKWKGKQAMYDPHNQELYVIVRMVTSKWRQYLQQQEVIVRTDNLSSSHLRRATAVPLTAK